MEANELMIGDLVTESMIPTELRVCRVAHIDGDMDSVVLYDIEDEDEYRIGRYAKYIKPIPLTEEILKSNGFSNYRGSLYDLQDPSLAASKEYDYFVIGHDYGDREGFEPFIEIKYVHELQHALRLWGLRDLADNFKIN